MQAKTAAFVALDGEVRGVLAIADALKPGAREAVTKLQDRGITVVMLTGDNLATANAIAEQAGIDRVVAEVLPGDKAAVIDKLRAEGKTVAMVGGGIVLLGLLVLVESKVAQPIIPLKIISERRSCIESVGGTGK